MLTWFTDAYTALGGDELTYNWKLFDEIWEISMMEKKTMDDQHIFKIDRFRQK